MFMDRRPSDDEAPEVPEGSGSDGDYDVSKGISFVHVLVAGSHAIEKLMPSDDAAWMDVLTTPWFVAEVRGASKLYDRIDEGPWGGGWAGVAYTVVSSLFFLWFTDFGIYLIHRGLHHPWVYKTFHKPHHKWISASSLLSSFGLRKLMDSQSPLLLLRTRSIRWTDTCRACLTTSACL
jgi:hypothetical protein